MTAGYSLTRRRAMRDLAVAIGGIGTGAFSEEADAKKKSYPLSCEERETVITKPKQRDGRDLSWRVGCEGPNLFLPRYLGNGLVGDKGPIFGGHAVVLLNFFGLTCLPCEKEVPYLNSIHERYSENGLYVSAVCLDAYQYETDEDKAKGITAGSYVAGFFHSTGQQPRYQVYLSVPPPMPDPPWDAQAYKAWGITGIPLNLLIAVDADPKTGKVIGAAHPDIDSLDTEVRKALRYMKQ